MKMIFLVDGDNNIGTGLQGIDLLTAEDTVLVFFGKGQTLANVKKLCAGTQAQVQYLESVKGGKNSLDFRSSRSWASWWAEERRISPMSSARTRAMRPP